MKTKRKHGERPAEGTQEADLLAALERAPVVDIGHADGPAKWLSVSDIMRLGIAQYGARIYTLRRDFFWPQGLDIVNHHKWSDEDQCNHSWYRIAPLPRPAAAAAEAGA